MKKIDLPLLLDAGFYAAAAWLFILGIMRYFRIPFGVCLAVSTLCALAVGGVVFLAVYGKHRRRALTREEAKRRDALLLHLALEQEERVRLALLAALTADGKDAHCDGDDLSADGTKIVPLFTMQPVGADAAARLLRKHAGEPFSLFCNDVTPEAEKLLSSFGRPICRGGEVFDLFERTGTTPEPLILGEVPRTGRAQKLRRAFSKKNARPVFLCAACLLFMSLFTLFPIYYLVAGSVLLSLSVGVRVLGYS